MSGAIGKPLRRVEDRRLLTGAGRFADDLSLPGQTYASFVRSPHAHARIRRIEVSAAKAVPGVVAALTGRDYAADGNGALAHFANGADHLDISKPAFGPEAMRLDPLPEQVPIAVERVRHVGEIVAVVVAETQEAARDAAEHVAVDYDPLPAPVDAREAAAPDAPRLWDGGNLCLAAANGDRAVTEAAFARAAHVVTLEMHNQRVSGAPLEPRSGVAVWDAAREMATLYAPSQGVHRYRASLAAALALPPERVRVVTGDVGGGFGVRSSCNAEYPLLVWAARRTGRPVKWTATRSEAFLSDFQARDVYGEGALALDRDGRFRALRLDYLGNLGAYPVNLAVLNNLMRMAGGAYDIPAVHVTVRGVLTATVPMSVYRGAGRPEATLLVERLIDLAAAELGLDRAEIRRRNLIPAAALPYASALGHRYLSGAFADNLETACRAIGWDGFAARRAEAEARGRLAGIGLVTYLETPTGAPYERADLGVLAEGRVEAVVGTQATGQGHETAFAQVVADTLQIPPEEVAVVFGDTDRVHGGGGTHSDRSLRLAGTVMVRAGEAILARAHSLAAETLEAAEADIAYADGRFTVIGTDRSVGLYELAAAEKLAATSELAERLHAQPTGAVACEVEVDPETGAVTILRYVTVDDVGRVVNPMIVEGQVHGGIAQGAGQALIERCVYDGGTGQLLSGSFLDYALPRADDLPSFSVSLAGLPAPGNPLGVKGGGECGTTPAPAAVVNAVVDALAPFGVRHLEMPLTPEKVYRAMRQAGG